MARPHLILKSETLTGWVALTLAVMALSCHPTLMSTPTQPLRGTYTFAVTPSSSCRVHGTWRFRADINQNGRDLEIELSEGDFQTVFLGSDKLNRFRGQDNSDGILLFSRGGGAGEYLFDEAMAGAWSAGQAKGEFRGDRITALFSGTFSPYGQLDQGDSCRAPDHSWTFVRR